MAELARREDDIKKDLEKLRAVEQGLRSPARLAAVVREKKMDLVVLGSAKPEAQATAGGKAPRRPGEVLDEGFERAEKPVRLATAGNW